MLFELTEGGLIAERECLGGEAVRYYTLAEAEGLRESLDAAIAALRLQAVARIKAEAPRLCGAEGYCNALLIGSPSVRQLGPRCPWCDAVEDAHQWALQLRRRALARARHFVPTHEITLTGERSGERTVFPVCLVDGSAYTLDEWQACVPADWERDDDGHWWFQGQASPPGVTVAIQDLRPWPERSDASLPDGNPPR